MSKSPFPGMDPFLEQDWLDVHSALVTYARDQIQDQLPADLCARMKSRVLLEDDSVEMQAHQHALVVEYGNGTSGGSVAVQVATADPDRIVVDVASEPMRESYIEIVDAQTRSRVITCIELVSPTNKRAGQGREAYLEKQAECLSARVNLVEIDLTRAGSRREIFGWLVTASPQPTYVAGVRRAPRMERVEMHEFPLDRPLKPIRIPLRPGEADAVLKLQPLLEQAYTRGRYGNLDYSRPPDPPLTGAEAEIAHGLLKEAGKI